MKDYFVVIFFEIDLVFVKLYKWVVVRENWSFVLFVVFEKKKYNLIGKVIRMLNRLFFVICLMVYME